MIGYIQIIKFHSMYVSRFVTVARYMSYMCKLDHGIRIIYVK